MLQFGQGVDPRKEEQYADGSVPLVRVVKSNNSTR